MDGGAASIAELPDKIPAAGSRCSLAQCQCMTHPEKLFPSLFVDEYPKDLQTDLSIVKTPFPNVLRDLVA